MEEVAYDYIIEGLDRFLYCPVTNYVAGDLSDVREMLLDPATLSGLSDGGAHCGSVVDASMPTYLLTHWARDRSRGPGLPLETVVKAQTAETADFYGFQDRGRLAPGLRADVNVIDHAGLRIHPPHLVNDLPAGSGWFRVLTVMLPPWSLARRSLSAANIRARCQENWCGLGDNTQYTANSTSFCGKKL